MDNDKPVPATPEVSFIDNPMAPDVYADEVCGFFVHNGVVKIAFASARVNHVSSPGPVNRVVIGRLALSIPAAQSLAVGLFDFLKQQGVDFSGVGPDGPSKPN
jgi:hypothetical protein